jgi:hypothetical protein
MASWIVALRSDHKSSCEPRAPKIVATEPHAGLAGTFRLPQSRDARLCRQDGAREMAGSVSYRPKTVLPLGGGRSTAGEIR